MCKFNCNKNCPNCEWYEPGGYYYESDSEGYRDEGCNIGEDPENCTKYEPTYVQSLLDKIEELKEELENFKKVDEDELDRLAEQSEKEQIRTAKQCEALGQCYGFDFQTGFKAGYRKAKVNKYGK